MWGASYGTRLGQAYARLFPASVRSMILDGVAAPEQIIFAWGKDAQASLDAVFKRCHEDAACAAAYPALPSQSRQLAETREWRRGNTRLRPSAQRAADAHEAGASQFRADRARRVVFRDQQQPPAVPDRCRRKKGNWRPFLAQMYSSSDFAVGGMATGLMLAVTCAEDLSRLTPQIVAEEERSSFLAGAEVKMIPGWCQYVKVPAITYREPSELHMPVLLLSGALDPVTPPYRADSARKHMPHGQAFVVANAGHGVSQLGCAPRLLREFLDQPQQALQAQCLADISRPSFQLGAAGPHP
ncbi:alpha/beta fold hydrolase [Undibacterium arcticum]